jgi:hypothetical protein
MLTPKQAIITAYNVRHTHGSAILKKLGLLGKNDGILGRIMVHETVDLEDKLLSMVYANMTYGHYLTEEEGRMTYKYRTHSATIHLRPLSHFTMFTPDGEVTMTPRIMHLAISKNKFEKLMIHTLAHEMRHYWQLITGEIYNHGVFVRGMDITPYKHSWREKDANSFADEYIKEMNN